MHRGVAQDIIAKAKAKLEEQQKASEEAKQAAIADIVDNLMTGPRS